MPKKENKGGELTNEQIEKDLQVKNNPSQENWYQGAQDTGDQDVRSLGTNAQKNDSLPDDDPEDSHTER